MSSITADGVPASVEVAEFGFFRDEIAVEVERGTAGCNQVRIGLKQTVILPDAQRIAVKALLDCLHAGSMQAGRQDFL